MIDTLATFKTHFLAETFNDRPPSTWPGVLDTYKSYQFVFSAYGQPLEKREMFTSHLREWGYTLTFAAGRQRFNGIVKPAKQLIPKDRELHLIQTEIIDPVQNLGPQRSWPTTTEVYDAYNRSYVSNVGDKLTRQQFGRLLRELGYTEVPAYGQFRVNCKLLTPKDK